MSYIGAEPNGMGKAERFTFTAAGGETTISVDDAGVPISYTENQVSVYLNGVKLVVGTGKDCQATNGSTITGLSALSANDVIEVVALSIFSATTVEGTALISTGQTGGTKFLREDGDGTASWQTATDATKAPLAGATFTGAVTVPTPTATGHAVTKAYSDLKAPLATPIFTGEVTAPSLILTPRTVPTSPAPAEGQVYYNNADNLVYVYNGSAWQQLTYVPFSATGGTITTSGSYKIHTFTASGTFTVSGPPGTVEYLVIGGGGGGGNDLTGGGGAGAYKTANGLAVTAQAYTITIGGGGAAGATSTASGSQGVSSVFSTITSIGGGGGGYNTGEDGGSGGGTVNGTAGSGSGGTIGNNGSIGTGGLGGGGGGAGTAGTTTVGGAGTASSITGSSVTRAGGAGGGGSSSNAGGTGGGGAGAYSGVSSVAGTANTGSGGGGGSQYGGYQAGAAGGSGIVIIRYTV